MSVRTDTAQATSAGALTYTRDLNGDGTTDGRGPSVTHRYERAGQYMARLTVTDPAGRSATDSVSVTGGNTAPTVAIDGPRPGGVVPFDTPIPYRISDSDSEDASVAADRLTVRAFVGRDSHELPLNAQSGVTGTFEVHRIDHYDPKERLFAALEARYTDGDAAGVGPLTGRAYWLLHPRRMKVELAPISKVAQTETLQSEDEGPARQVVTVETGHHIAHPSVNHRNIDALTFEVALMAGGRIEVRRGAPDGPLLAEVSVPTASLDSSLTDSAAADRDYGDLGRAEEDWREMTVSVSAPSGADALYLVFQGREGAPLLRLDGWQPVDGRRRSVTFHLSAR